MSKSCATAALLALTIILAGCQVPEKIRPDQHAPYQAELEERVLELINAERQKRNLHLLQPDPALRRVAYTHCTYMRDNDILTHRDARGREISERIPASISWQAIAENVARNRGFGDPVAEAVRGWLASEGHRRNILGPDYRETGIGVAECRRTGYWYFAQVFILRRRD